MEWVFGVSPDRDPLVESGPLAAPHWQNVHSKGTAKSGGGLQCPRRSRHSPVRLLWQLTAQHTHALRMRSRVLLLLHRKRADGATPEAPILPTLRVDNQQLWACWLTQACRQWWSLAKVSSHDVQIHHH